MTYIYDILLNFKDDLYEFYDWNKTDNIIHIRKIPIIKISTEDLWNIKNNNVKFDSKNIEKIKNKTEIFTSKMIKRFDYMFLLSDGNFVMGVMKKDKKIKKSSLLIDEEIDTLEELKYLDYENIEYKIINKNLKYELKTRKQIEEEKFIIKEINKITNEEEKLKYIYYDCFNRKENNIDKILLHIKQNIDNKNIKDKLYRFFKLIEIKK